MVGRVFPRHGHRGRPLNSIVSLQMNKPPSPPPLPKFERPSEPWALSAEDLEWLEQAEREGRLPNMTIEEAIAAVNAGREQFFKRLRRAGFDPGAGDGSKK